MNNNRDLKQKTVEAIDCLLRRVENTKKTNAVVFSEVNSLVEAADPMFRFIFGRNVIPTLVDDVLAWQILASELASVAPQIAEKIQKAIVDNNKQEKEDEND